MFHRWIGRKVAAIKKKGDFIEPEKELDPKEDHAVGVMSDDLKALFTLWRKTGQESHKVSQAAVEAAKKMVVGFPSEPKQADFDDAKGKLLKLEAKVSLARSREDAMREAFWLSVRDEFPQLNSNSLAVCKGFQVAWTEDEEEMPHMMGGSIRGIIIPIRL